MEGDESQETLEQMQSRHKTELKDLQGKVTSKKKNATKKTRKGVNDECAEMERVLREKQGQEVASLETEAAQPINGQEGGQEEGQKQEHEQRQQDGTENILQGATLEKAAADLHISPPDEGSNPDPDSKQGREQQQQPGKKRNRQKERLARRAAEQEAAAEAAATEASTMTDHRAKESGYMKKMFETYGLVEKEIQPDGHCLFSAVGDQLRENAVPLGPEVGGAGGQPPAYKLVRETAADYMEGHSDDFAPFLDENLAAYTAKMRNTAEWGGQLELTALSRAYNVEIRVIQDGRTEQIGEGEGLESGKTLWLAYYRHGYGLGEHYNSLRKK